MLMGKFSHKMQHNNYDCGAACVATILNHYNQAHNFNDLKYKLGTDTHGTSLLNICKTLNDYSFKSKVYKIKDNFELILKNIDLPCVALLNNKDINHYVVIHKITDKSLIISDPLEIKLKKEKWSSFKENFAGVLLLIDPKEVDTSKPTNKQTKEYKKKILSFIKTEKLFLTLTFFLSLMLTIFGVATSYFTGILVDGIIPHNLKDALHIFALIFISFALIQATFQYFRDKLIIKMSAKLEKKLTMRYFNHLLRIPPSQIRNKEIGEFISRFNDGLTITQMFSSTLIATVVDFLLIFISGYLMIYVSPNLFILTLIPVILYAIICYLYFDKISIKNRKVMEEHANVNSFFIQMLNGIENIKALRKEENISNINESKFNNYIGRLLNLQRTNNVSSYFRNMIRYVCPIAIIWMGGLQIISSQLSIGNLVTFLSLSAFFFTSVQNIANIQPQIQQAIIAAERFFDIISSNIIEDDLSGEKNIGKINSIRIEDLNFKYKNEKNILNNLSLDIKENEIVSFAGESGSGKSTVAKLLVGFLEAADKSIYINDIDINNINIQSLREKICYINDKRFFIPGTIKENLTLGRKFSEDEIELACKLACIDQFIKNLDKGYDHTILEDSSNLSLGQAQRLSLARALLHKPDVLILDEVLSNLDEANAIKIMENIKSIGTITIFINHNSYLFNHYDKVYNFSKTENKVQVTKGAV